MQVYEDAHMGEVMREKAITELREIWQKIETEYRTAQRYYTKMLLVKEEDDKKGWDTSYYRGVLSNLKQETTTLQLLKDDVANRIARIERTCPDCDRTFYDGECECGWKEDEG